MKNKTFFFHSTILNIILLLFIIFVWGCNHESNDSSHSDTDTSMTTSDKLSSTQINDISKRIGGTPSTIEQQDVELKSSLDNENFRIIEEKEYNSSECILRIRVSEQLDKNQLTEIAQLIRTDYHSYKRLLIFYLLPEMEITDGAWATSHFNPNLEVKILGTPEEQKARIEKKVDKKSDCDPSNFYSYKNYQSHIWKYVDQKTNLGSGWGRFVTSTDDIRISSYGNGYYKIDIYEYNASHPDITIKLKYSHKSLSGYYYVPCGDNEYIIKEKLKIVECVGKLSDMATGKRGSIIYFIYQDDESYSEKGIAYKLKG